MAGVPFFLPFGMFAPRSLSSDRLRMIFLHFNIPIYRKYFLTYVLIYGKTNSPNDGEPRTARHRAARGEPEGGNAGSTRTVSRKPLGAGRHTTGGEGGGSKARAEIKVTPSEYAQGSLGGFIPNAASQRHAGISPNGMTGHRRGSSREEMSRNDVYSSLIKNYPLYRKHNFLLLRKRIFLDMLSPKGGSAWSSQE